MGKPWPNIHHWLVPQQPPRRRRTMALLTVLLLLGLGHTIVLRLLAWPLLAGDSPTACNYFCIHGGELGADGFEPFDAAVAWHDKLEGRKILLLVPHTSRIVEIGAVPSFEQTCRKELNKRGISSGKIRVIHSDASNVWEEAHAMADWLKERPGETVVLACSPFTSGRLRYVLNKVLGAASANRVQLATLPDPGCSPETWWRSRKGVKEFMYAWLELMYSWAHRNYARPNLPNAVEFQHDMRAKIGEAPR